MKPCDSRAVNVLAGARVLRKLYNALGSWEAAIQQYNNGSRKFLRKVLASREELRRGVR